MAAPTNEFVSTTPPATRTRFVVALWLCGLAAVLYLDRICMSQAVVPIQRDLNLTNTQISYVHMAFTLAYGLFEIPTGRLGDRKGARAVLTRIVIWWSIFTALTGACTGLYSLVVVRFLFGAGEAGAFPNAARVLSRWFLVSERGRVQGVMLAAAQFGAVAAPVVAAQLIELVGWRWAFSVFGAIGIVWAVGFWVWFRDDPARHPAVNATELTVIRTDASVPTEPGPIPWPAVLMNRGILALSFIMIVASFYSYFAFSWFPKYLVAAHGVKDTEASEYSSMVLAGSATGMLIGGWLADRIPRWSSDAIATRRYLGVGCYLVAAACLFVGIRCESLNALVALWGASYCAMHITLPSWWSTAIPQGGRHVGALFGLMNGLGVIGALSSQWFVGAFSDWRGGLGYTGRAQWDPMFDLYVGVLGVGAIAWWLYRYRPLPEPTVAGVTP